MDEQRAWIRSRRKKRLRIVAVILCMCLLATTHSDILATLSAFATEWKDSTVYVSGFGELPEAVRAQTVPVGTGIEELSLPDTLEAFAETPEDEDPSGDAGGGGADKPGDIEDGKKNPPETPEGEGGNQPGGESGKPGEGTDGGSGDAGNAGEGTGDAGNTSGESGKPGEGTDGGSGDAGNTGEGSGGAGESGGGSGDVGNTDEGSGGAGESGGGSDESGNTGEGTDGDAGSADEGNSGEGEPESQSDTAPADDEGGAGTADEMAKEDGGALTVRRGVFAMPVYLSEPEASAEPQTMERKEESVMIKGVTWQSEPAYDGNVEGTYVFTAILPDGYALTEGTSLPQITVTVQGTDPAVQELLARIAALPEAEEYLAGEPDVEAEDEYEAWMDKLSAYTAEALDLWEIYETLTEEQRAQVPTEALVKLAAWVELAGQLAEGSMVMAAAETGGTFGDGLTWKLEGNTLTISGTGDMPDWAKVEDTPWYGSRGDIKSVIIENGVTNIGSHAFLNCSALTSIKIPNSVTSIGDKAFYDCKSLISVTIPNNVTSIGSSAFQNCESLSSVAFIEGGSIPTLGWGCFYGCPCVKGTGRGISIPSCKYLTKSDWLEYKNNVTIKEPHTLTHTNNVLKCSVCETEFSETITAENCDIATAVADENYTVTFTPNSGYAVPTEVTVQIGGTALGSDDYTYDSAAGKLTISIGKITGNVTINAAAVKQVTIEVTLKKDGSPWNGQTVTLKKDGATYEVHIGGSGIYRFKVPKGGMYGIYVNNQSTGIDINTDQNYDNFHETLYYLTMTYNANGADGTVPPKRDCSCGRKESSSTWQHSVDKTLPMRKQGCVQIGWSEASDGSSGIAEIIVVNDGKGNVKETPITLYPVFAPAKVTINAENCTHDGAAEVAASGDYIVTFTPETGYDVPAGVTVEIGGTPLGSGDYTYNGTTGTLTIPRDKITGHVTITAEAAQHRHSLSYKVSGQTIVESCNKCDHSVAAGFKTSQSAPYTYTGSAIQPFDVSYTGGTWLWSIKPVISYTSNTNAGTATATLTYNSLSVEKTFTIDKKDISDDSVTVSLDTNSPTYTGSAITPTVTVEDGSRTLIKDTDYTVAYADNTAIGTATITITGKGNYTGTRTEEFTIGKQDLSASRVTVTLGDDSRQYTGQAIELPHAQVIINDIRVTEGTDYTVRYENNINAGSNARIIIIGKGNYAGECAKTFTITPKSLTGATVTAAMLSDSHQYSGTGIEPTVTVRDSAIGSGGSELVKGRDYTVAYQNNTAVSTDASKGQVILTGTGNYTGTLTETFTIVPKSLEDASVTATLDKDSYQYTGNVIEPAVTVRDSAIGGGTALVKDRDYTVAYADNTAVGTNTAKVTVTGKGNYTGVRTLTFTIQDKAPEVSGDDLDFSGGTAKLPDDMADKVQKGEVEIYDSDGNQITPNPDGSLPDVEPGTTITIKYPGSDKETEVQIPPRPAAPAPVDQGKVEKTDTTIKAPKPSDGAAYEYVLVEKGEKPDWSRSNTTGEFTGLAPNKEYDLYMRKPATEDSFASEPVKTEVRTSVTIQEPEVSGAGGGNDVSGGKPSADGGSVTYTGTCERGSTPVIIVDGEEIVPEITWDADGKKGTWSYTVPVKNGDSEVGITVEFKDCGYKGLEIEPGSLRIHADDTANQSADKLLDYLKAHCIIKAAYDNGTSDDVTAGAVYKTDSEFNARGAVYEYTVEVNAETREVTLTVSPVTAAVKAPDALSKSLKPDGYTRAEVDAWLPEKVTVTYTGADGYAQRTESRPVTWNTDALGAGFGASEGSKTVSGTVDLPVWATGENTVGIGIGFADRRTLTGDQMQLSVSGWAYGAQTAPAPKGSVAVTDTEQTYTYSYSADGGASWVTAAGLPKSASGHIIPGDYLAKMTYTGRNYTGTKTASFTVVQKPVTAEKGTLAVKDRNYDGTTNATLKAGGKPALSGVFANDDVSLSGTLKAVFTGKGPKKNISVTVTGFALAGKDAGYYKLINTTLTLKATINNKDGSSPSSGSGNSGNSGSSGNSSNSGNTSTGGSTGNGGNTSGNGSTTGSGSNKGTGSTGGSTGNSGTGGNKGTGSTGSKGTTGVTGKGNTGSGSTTGTGKSSAIGTGKGSTGTGSTSGTGKGTTTGTGKGTIGNGSTGNGTTSGTDKAKVGTGSGSTAGNGGTGTGKGAGGTGKDSVGSGSGSNGGTDNGEAGARQADDGQQAKTVTVQTVQAETNDGRIVLPDGTEAPVAIGSLTEDAPGATRLMVGEGTVTVTVVCEDDQYTAGMNDAPAVANAVLTPEQIQLVDSGERLEVRVDIKNIAQSISLQDRETVEKGFEAYGKYIPELMRGGYVDISVYTKTGDGGWNAVAETIEPLEVVIGIPEELRGDGREYYIIRAHEGRYTLLNDMDEAPETITIVTDQFSSYAIAYQETGAANTENGETAYGLSHTSPKFLGIVCLICLTAAVAGIIIVIIVLRKKKGYKRENC